MLNSNCPCCANTLLRHIRSGEVYWFCRHCHQEMPNYATLSSPSNVPAKLRHQSRSTQRNPLILSYR